MVSPLAIVSVKSAVTPGLAAALKSGVSCNRTTKLEVPTLVGVPVSEPFGLSVSPAGNVPLARDHEYGGVPPVPLNANEYGVATFPFGSGELEVMASVGGRMEKLNVLDAVRLEVLTVESRTETVTLTAPAEVGVPVSSPLGLSVGANTPVADTRENV
jgi:hypothetical protein